MPTLERGKYRASTAGTPDELRAAQALRAKCFRLKASLDTDRADENSTHVLIKNSQTNVLVGCFRMLEMPGAQIGRAYASDLYDLSALEKFEGLMLELGRFCIDPNCDDPDVLRLAWAVLTAHVDARKVRFLFGCTSFQGTDPGVYGDAFSWLGARHRAPRRWAPGIKGKDVFFLTPGAVDPLAQAAVQSQMPPLLRTYLTMGAWVSDHGVVDHEMNTLHVFTGLEIDGIPQVRKRLLRAL